MHYLNKYMHSLKKIDITFTTSFPIENGNLKNVPQRSSLPTEIWRERFFKKGQSVLRVDISDTIHLKMWDICCRAVDSDRAVMENSNDGFQSDTSGSRSCALCSEAYLRFSWLWYRQILNHLVEVSLIQVHFHNVIGPSLKSNCKDSRR